MNRFLLLSSGAIAVIAPRLHAQVPIPLPEARSETVLVAPAAVEPPPPARAGGTVSDPPPANGSAELLASPDAFAATGIAGGWQPLATRTHLSGDWFGLRPRLADRGVTFEGNVTQFAFGLNGGVDRLPPGLPLPLQLGDRFAYTGRGDYALTFDLEKFGGMPYGKLLVRAQHWFGDFGNVSLSTGALPPAIFPAALPPVPNHQGVPYLTDFVVTQPLSKEWVVFAGKKNVIGAADQDDFAGGNGTFQFLNQAFIANPAFLLALPYTSFTAGVVSPREWGGFSVFVYDPQNRTRDFFRLNDLFSEGIIVGGELKFKTNFLCKPGEQHFGGIWKHLELTDLRFNEPPPGVYPYPTVPGFPTIGDSFTLYYGFDQYLQVYSEDTKRGWGLFGRASISDGNPTPFRYFLSLGVGGYSPIRHKQGDAFGVGVYYTGVSREFGPIPRALFGPRDGWGVEMYYNVQVTPWLNVTPDVQIIQPESRAIADMAYVAGVRMNLRF